MFPLGFRDPSIGMSILDGGELVICSRDAGISGCDEEWLGDVLCLLRSFSSGNAGGPFRCKQAGLEGPGSLERNRLGPRNWG